MSLMYPKVEAWTKRLGKEKTAKHVLDAAQRIRSKLTERRDIVYFDEATRSVLRALKTP
jgi:hypothetical protein